jgi:hypothetical protein
MNSETPPITILRAIIELNNQTASSIGNGGNYTDALLHDLSDALQTLRQITSSFDIKNGEQTAEDDEEMDVLDSAESSLDSLMAKRTCSSATAHEFGEIKKDDTSDSVGGDFSSSFVYRHPIHIPTSLSEQYDANFITISTVIVFNLALATHLSATKKDDNYRETLRTAARLYDSVFELQRAQRSAGSFVLFLTATINNLGVVYQQLDDDEMACKCFGQLLSTLMYLTDCQESGDRSVLSISEFGGFFRNVFPCCSGAAPAA